MLYNNPDLEETRKLLLDQRLQRILVTPFREMDSGLNGLPPAFFFSVVIELQGGDLIELQNAWIGPWKGDTELREISREQFRVPEQLFFEGQKIKDMAVDEQQRLYVRLNNDVILQTTVDWGDDLKIDFFDAYFSGK